MECKYCGQKDCRRPGCSLARLVSTPEGLDEWLDETTEDVLVEDPDVSDAELVRRVAERLVDGVRRDI